MAFIHGLRKLCMMRTKVLCVATSELGNIVLVKVGYITAVHPMKAKYLEGNVMRFIMCYCV